MTCYDSDNLPPGLAPSGIPGNSPKEIAVERAMEAVYEMTQGVVDELWGVSKVLDAFEGGAEDIQTAIKAASDLLEGIQTKLDNARHILGRVLE